MSKWDLYVRSPRWLEVSGLPQKLAREHGPGAWVVFRKFTELDCEANLTPDWFSVSTHDLAVWTGVSRADLLRTLDYLGEAGLVDLQELAEGWRVRIHTPLEVPGNEDRIRERLRELGLNSSCVRLRYRESDSPAERFARILDLYQGVFGVRMTSHIADELREIAEHFEWPAIEEAFNEAREQKKTNFQAVMNQLYKEIWDEKVSENIRDASGPSLPAGYELT